MAIASNATAVSGDPFRAAQGGTYPDSLVVVAGTGTEVGKTWVGCRLIEELRARGVRVAARKPAQSYELGTPLGVTDAALLAAAAGCRPEEVCPPHRWYGAAMAPPMAALALGRSSFTIADLLRELRWPERGQGGGPSAVTDASAGDTSTAGVSTGDTSTGKGPSVGLVELAGGLRSPLAQDGDCVDLVARLRPDMTLLVGDAGLGTINESRLSIDTLVAHGGADPATVVVILNRFQADDRLHRANRVWLADRYGFDVVVTPGEEGALADRVFNAGHRTRRDHDNVPSSP